jgi:hypothetical protein
VRVVAPPATTLARGASAQLRFRLSSLDASAQTYQLAATSGNGWIVQHPPGSLFVPGNTTVEVAVTVRVPPDATPESFDAIWLSAVQQSDSAVVAEDSTLVFAPSAGQPSNSIFLPAVMRNQRAGALGFDSQFAGPAVGWQPITGMWTASGGFYWTPGVANGWANTAYATSFANFDYQARLFRYGCNTCANSLVIRGQPQPLGAGGIWHSEYLFQYARNGQFSVWKIVAGGAPVALQPWTATAAILTSNAWNTLRVVAIGSDLHFYINGTLVWSGDDASLSAGQVGIGMYHDGSSGNTLYVDWATLTDYGTDAQSAPLALDTLRAEQQALNAAAQEGVTGEVGVAPPEE